ncbi:hypothetical protein [Parasitella parasitica]|uniref:Uncharacterized protein n=1 Tax=Parasitella parasitica TaxID=35722 RepID=A0A0B7NAC8_9FUNG|nr:hypothetical protein [Parasitella parasitica]
MPKQKNNQKIPESTYVDKNKDDRYRRYMAHHRERANMQRAIRRMIEKREMYTTDKAQIRKQILHDVTSIKSFAKKRKLKKLLETTQDVLAQLRIHFWGMCHTANYWFPPFNWDNGVRALANEDPIEEPLQEDTSPPPDQDNDVRNFFYQHPTYAHRIIILVLRAGMALGDDFQADTEVSSYEEEFSHSEDSDDHPPSGDDDFPSAQGIAV